MRYYAVRGMISVWGREGRGGIRDSPLPFYRVVCILRGCWLSFAETLMDKRGFIWCSRRRMLPFTYLCYDSASLDLIDGIAINLRISRGAAHLSSLYNPFVPSMFNAFKPARRLYRAQLVGKDFFFTKFSLIQSFGKSKEKEKIFLKSFTLRKICY